LHWDTGALSGAALTWVPLCAIEPNMSRAIAKMIDTVRAVRDLTIRAAVHFERATSVAAWANGRVSGRARHDRTVTTSEAGV